MRDAGAAHAVSGRGGLEASQHAPTEARKDSAETRANTDKETLQSIANDIRTARIGLEEEGVESTWLNTLSQLAKRVENASRTRQTCEKGVEGRLKAIEESLKALTAPSKGQTTTWAAVAAGSTRLASYPPAPPPARHNVRISMPQAKGLGNREILEEIRKTIPEAAAIRTLQSGDIDVTVPSEAAKERAQSLPPSGDLKVHKRDYLIELPGVPLSTRVVCGKQADNGRLAAGICEASKQLSPGIRITRIFWLYSDKQMTRMREAGKQRGSLIIGVSSEEMRRTAIKGGIVIDTQLFEARFFETALRKTQCYKCQQWGHTQAACVKPARCGSCAGPHNTRDCSGERISCANCGDRHKTWNLERCRAYQRYHETIQRRRAEAQIQAMRVRDASDKQTTGLGDNWTIVRKRLRDPSPKGSTPHRIGRPTLLEQAAREPNQLRLNIGASASQTTSSEDDSEGMDIVTQNE